MTEKDRISELPADILDTIMGFLPIKEAARTAFLSTFWKDIWFSLTKLNFGYDFFGHIYWKYSDGNNDWESAGFDVINKILMQHNGLIQKFVFHFRQANFAWSPYEEFEATVNNSLLSDIYQWLLLLTQNGVKELDLSCYIEGFRLPNCIFSCPTLKRLKLSKVSVKLVNGCCVLPNVTSLCLEQVDFQPRDHPDCAVHLPMLEDLSFVECKDMFYFNIVAPKLGSLKIISFECFCYYPQEFGTLPPNLDLGSISSLDLVCSICLFQEFIEELTRVGEQPLGLNIEYMKLYIHGCFERYINISEFIHLLRRCPKLYKLDILQLATLLKFNLAEYGLLEELSSMALSQKTLCTLIFSQFEGWRPEMQFIKVLLACFPGIEKVIIIIRKHNKLDKNKEFKIMQELLYYPRASTKAEFVYIEYA